ncbi:transposase [Streptomyces acidiscabies]|uniref:transposase n=1 Tax=Streptomyces acidiscabies TaxID=42234 RepID=UPI0038F63520
MTADGAQRTDSTQVISAVLELNRLELLGESVRAALEALATAAPGWLAESFPTVVLGEWAERYGPRINSWQIPSAKAKREQLGAVFAADAYAICSAAWEDRAPVWVREIEHVELLRQVPVQTAVVDGTDVKGRVALRLREKPDGVPPGALRLASPYDTDARWGSHGQREGRDVFWLGCTAHLTETCRPHDSTADPPPGPNLITDVHTTHAAAPDLTATAGIGRRLAAHGLAPAEHSLDAGYPSTRIVADAAAHGTTMITPLLRGSSRALTGFRHDVFRIDWTARQATCPQGRTSSGWYPCRQHGQDAIVVEFARTDYRPCPVRAQCTTAKRGFRSLSIHPDPALHTTLHTARATQHASSWERKYALRAGIEGTINQALDVTDLRQARYRGLRKTRLQHAFSAAALNLIRLDAYWNDPAPRPRHTSRLMRLYTQLAP